MKNQIQSRSLQPYLLALGLLTAPVFHAAATLTWTNAAGDLQWSTAVNWSPNATPTADDTVLFDNVQGFTNVPAAVNSVVDTSVTVSNLFFEAVTTNGYHTLLLNPGVTLTVDSSQVYSNESNLTVSGSLGLNNQMYATIRGTGGSLVVGIPGAPKPNFGLSISVTCTNTVAADSSHRATLDLSGLDSFTYAGGYVLVAGSGSTGAGNQPAGTLLLARTNVIIASRATAASTAGTIRISHNSAGNATGQSENLIELGQENTILTEYLRIGGSKALNGGAIRFRAGLSNPTLRLRAPDDINRMPLLTLGDNSDTSTGVASSGVLDLNGGIVDAQVDSLFVGRSYDAGTTTSGNGNGTGTLTFSGGTLDVTTLNLGYQVRNNNGIATGVLNVRSNASLIVDTLRIGRDAGSANGTGNGTLNIVHGGQVAVTNNILENSATITGTSTINITNGTLTVGGLVRVDNLTVQNATLNLTVGPTITTANPICNVTNLTLATAATFNISGSLAIMRYPLVKYMGSIGGEGFNAAALGALPVDVSGYLSNNTANSSIDLVVTNVPAKKWDGVVNGDWDIATTTNWIDTITGAATTYWEDTPPGDPVVFDDTASGTKTVNLTTTLSPQSVVVNTTNSATPYVFTGFGGIAGATDLTKTGSGILEVASSVGNSYTGPTIVAGGTLLINGSLAGGGSVTIQSGATLGGAGVIIGPVTISDGGTLAPGTSIGTLNIFGDLVLASTSTNVFEVNTDTLEHDMVTGISTLTFGGTLVIRGSGGGTALTAGAAIQLFSAGNYGGAFTAIEPAFPGPGMNWDTSTLTTDGTLRVMDVPPGNDLVWTKLGGDLLWSNSANWLRTNRAYGNGFASNSVPTIDDRVFFANDIGVTNGPGLVNNTVTADTEVGPMAYEALEPGYHTLLINPGVTLAVSNGFPGAGEVFGFRGALNDSSKTGYMTIRGQGRLIVGDTNSPNSSIGNRVSVHAVESVLPPSTTQGAHTNGPFMATLDMSGLDYFASATAEMRIGASDVTGRGTRGTLILAKTNLIICGQPDNNYYGLIVGSTVGGNYQPGGSMGELQLGQVNDIRAFSVKAGASRAQLGTIKFQGGLTNPTVRMRNLDGASPMGLLAVGDNYRTSAANTAVSTPETATGIMDFSGGTVDILVGAMRVGRNLNSSTTTTDGSGNGTLTWTAGTIECTGTTDLGRQNNNNLGNCMGVVNVLSNAVWIGDDIRFGSDAGSAAGTGNGTLNIVYGGKVVMASSITEESPGGGSSTINITNGALVTGGAITVDTVNAIGGVISNSGLLTASTVLGDGIIAGPVTISGMLAPGTSVGTLTIFNDLTLSSTSTSAMEVNLDTLTCDKVVGLNNVNFGGVLQVSSVAVTSAVTNGTTLQLFDAANYSGAFAATNLPVLGGGWGWDTSGLANGTLKIVTAVSTIPPNLTFTVTGNALDISWPSDHMGWRLEGQTNVPGTGLTANWFPVDGSTLTNQMLLPINPANGSSFFRLVYP